MSTEFRSQETGEWVCTRWACKRVGSAALDFGSEERFRLLEALALKCTENVTLVSEVGEEVDLVVLLAQHAVTFGEFVGTVELGSGELLDRTGEEH